MKNQLLKLSSILLLSLGLSVLPAKLDAQCVTNVVSSYTDTVNGMNYQFISKSIATTGTCTRTMTNNVIGCGPAGMNPGINAVWASAYTAATSPSCDWVCECGPVTIDGSDGLPVELLGFEIDGEASTGQEEDQGASPLKRSAAAALLIGRTKPEVENPPSD